MKKNIILMVLLIGRTQFGFGQGFMNLNFESTTLATNGAAGTVSTALGLPGWTALIGGQTQSTILYNNATLGASSIAVVTASYSQIDGNFSAQLIGGASGDATISQTGLVPANADSIFFDAIPGGFPANNLVVSLNGQAINIFLYSALSGYNIYAGDVSSFAGQTANLAFTVPASTPFVRGYTVDDISFSPTVVPEPSTLALSGLGGLLVVWRNRRVFSRT